MNLIDHYRVYLVGLVDDGQAFQYPEIFEVGWEMPFSWSIPMDENRYLDGLELREAFEREASVALPDLGPCRVLEFLIGISKHLEFILFNYQSPEPTSYWFWQLMRNLRLTDIGPHNTYEQNLEIVRGTFNRVLSRTYDRLGNGGLFPLRLSERDQREVEIWYQMHEWIFQQQASFGLS